jgi:heme-degrading monooxygenase HmoA
VIVRVLTARVKPGRTSQFNALIRQQLPIIREQPGLLYAKLARRLERDGGEEVILFEEWSDADSVYQWAGGNLTRPRLLPGAEEELLDVRVTHYEALDLSPEGIPESVSRWIDAVTAFQRKGDREDPGDPGGTGGESPAW